MLLDQTKLTKSEWQNIERAISPEEKTIVKLIMDGYANPNLSVNHTVSLFAYLKVAHQSEMEEYLFIKYLQPKLQKLSKKYGFPYQPRTAGKKTIRKADMVRLQNADENIPTHVFEMVLLDMVKQMYKRPEKRDYYHYTLRIITSYDVPLKNSILVDFIRQELVHGTIALPYLLGQSESIIEQNDALRKYANLGLYDHQKRLFTVAKRPDPKLVLYVAPTGTGKTLSPIGLAEAHRIIFVCAARHVGLSLARTAVSMKKKVAFAFGCDGPEDIRLHYYSAKEYTKNRRTGGIGKVDNSVGDDVEIMITDVKSYLPAMYYMLAFNEAANLVLYWDEPTITLDYESHECHPLIQENWAKNEIPNVVLSSATLPSRDELAETVGDFKRRFMDAECIAITSHDCKRSIQLLQSNGHVAMPHQMSHDYEEVCAIAAHCRDHKTLYRYLDLKEAAQFILRAQSALTSPAYAMEGFFDGLESVTMERIKECYIETLCHIRPGAFGDLIETSKRTPISNIHVVSTDAHTLTNGPTIFLADDIQKVARFYLQEARIPESVARTIKQSLKHNTTVENKLVAMQKAFEDGTSKDASKEKKMTDGRVAPEMVRLQKEIDRLQTNLKTASLDPMFVPNSKAHLERYASTSVRDSAVPFTSDLGESTVTEIMSIDGVEDTWKLLLLMGVGVFSEHHSATYTEIMKDLAQQQKLYLIIASTDYIYGTNYQFCHGYIGKDLKEMTQEKCIQAMGRVGRNHSRQHYTIRFRHDPLIKSLFQPAVDKPEVANMVRLFNSAV